MDNESIKTCSCCKVSRPTSMFHKSKGFRDGLAYLCKPCARQKTKEWGIKNPERKKEAANAWRANNKERHRRSQYKSLVKKYGITIEVHEEMSKRQGELCAICLGPQIIGKRLAVDHCHATGRVRGLLCDNCNKALGLLRDNPEILARAITYLQQPHQ